MQGGRPPAAITRKSRGSLGRNLNPLGTLVRSVSSRGPNSERRLAAGRSQRRCAIRKSRHLVSETTLRVVRPAVRRTARRSRRIPVRSPVRPGALGFPMAPETLATASGWLSPPRTSWSGSAAGFPLRRDRKRRRPTCGQATSSIDCFSRPVFAFSRTRASHLIACQAASKRSRVSVTVEEFADRVFIGHAPVQLPARGRVGLFDGLRTDAVRQRGEHREGAWIVLSTEVRPTIRPGSVSH